MKNIPSRTSWLSGCLRPIENVYLNFKFVHVGTRDAWRHTRHMHASHVTFFFFFFFFFEISIDYPEEVTNRTKTWGLQNSRTKCWFYVVSSIARVIRGWYSVWWRVWVVGGVVGWVTLRRQICLRVGWRLRRGVST